MNSSSDILKQNRRTILAILIIPITGVLISLILIAVFGRLKIPMVIGILGALTPYLITVTIIWKKLLT